MILSTNEKNEANYYKKDILRKCQAFISSHDMKNLPCGKYEIDGEKLYVNVVSYDTKDERECIWEAHREYLDVHYIIKGKELIKLANINDMNIRGYIEEKDFVKLDGTESSFIYLLEGQYLTLFFEDAHMTGGCIGKPQVIKKAIFKISKKLLEK